MLGLTFWHHQEQVLTFFIMIFRHLKNALMTPFQLSLLILKYTQFLQWLFTKPKLSPHKKSYPIILTVILWASSSWLELFKIRVPPSSLWPLLDFQHHCWSSLPGVSEKTWVFASFLILFVRLFPEVRCGAHAWPWGHRSLWPVVFLVLPFCSPHHSTSPRMCCEQLWPRFEAMYELCKTEARAVFFWREKMTL